MRIRWGMAPINDFVSPNALYGLAITEYEERVEAWHYIIVRRGKHEWQVRVVTHGHVATLPNHYATLNAAKSAALQDAADRLAEVAA